MALWFPISVNGLPSFVQIMMVADVAGANPPSKLAASPSLAEYFYSLAWDSQTHLALSLPQAWNPSAFLQWALFLFCVQKMVLRSQNLGPRCAHCYLRSQYSQVMELENTHTSLQISLYYWKSQVHTNRSISIQPCMVHSSVLPFLFVVPSLTVRTLASLIFKLLTYAVSTPTCNCTKRGYLTSGCEQLYADLQGHWVKVKMSRQARDVSCSVQSSRDLGGSRTSLFTHPGICRSLAYTWLQMADQSHTKDRARDFSPSILNTRTTQICLESSHLETKYVLSN